MDTLKQPNCLLALLALVPVTLYTLGEFLACYYMITGSSGWCEPIIALF